MGGPLPRRSLLEVIPNRNGADSVDLVLESGNACNRIDHWLLTDGDEATIWAIEIKYQVHDATNQKSGNEDRQSGAKRVKPARITRKAAGNSSYPEKR